MTYWFSILRTSMIGACAALITTCYAHAATVLDLTAYTSPELVQKMQAGYTAVLVPTGGTEQNGPHLTVGKHNCIISYAAQEIAARDGHMLVAPVIAYVPEGEARHPGTLSLRPETFEAVLTDTAHSLKAQGFTEIYFVGDSSGNQQPQQRVAEKLTRTWRRDGITVTHLSAYFNSTRDEQILATHGVPTTAIGAHAGVIETSQLLFIDPTQIRSHELRSSPDISFSGEPWRASRQLGKLLMEAAIRDAAQQIAATRHPAN